MGTPSSLKVTDAIAVSRSIAQPKKKVLPVIVCM
jgi:hypothetical protein